PPRVASGGTRREIGKTSGKSRSPASPPCALRPWQLELEPRVPHWPRAGKLSPLRKGRSPHVANSKTTPVRTIAARRGAADRHGVCLRYGDPRSPPHRQFALAAGTSARARQLD